MSVAAGGASGSSPARARDAAHTSNKTYRHTWNRKRALLITPVHSGNERARPAPGMGPGGTKTTSKTAPREFRLKGSERIDARDARFGTACLRTLRRRATPEPPRRTRVQATPGHVVARCVVRMQQQCTGAARILVVEVPGA